MFFLHDADCIAFHLLYSSAILLDVQLFAVLLTFLTIDSWRPGLKPLAGELFFFCLCFLVSRVTSDVLREVLVHTANFHLSSAQWALHHINGPV